MSGRSHELHEFNESTRIIRGHSWNSCNSWLRPFTADTIAGANTFQSAYLDKPGISSLQRRHFDWRAQLQLAPGDSQRHVSNVRLLVDQVNRHLVFQVGNLLQG